jgi:tetratricopeptide (TPR) repeat protein
MTDLAETMPEAPDADWADAQIGRYKMRRLVGTGGMGVVVAAHDPELDREVAIKIVSGDEAARPIREAQAMAKLSHPNVVQVYEVVRLGARTAIVMELVAGEELGAWVKDRPWREIVDAYAQACRGLAAAHRVDIVHRDFKPSNALVDKDGVVRVTDFGLAHASKDTPLDSAGTPAYMAPEQHRRGDVDARTDQWSVACSLYEALYGRRPFEGSTRSELAASVTRGEIAAEPTDSPVPRHVRAAIRRGLALDPANRFDTIEQLAAAITHRPRTTQYALAAMIGVAVIVAIVLLSRRRDDPQCQDLDAPLNVVWSTQARSALRARLLAKDVGLPEVTVDRALRGLDAYARSWVSTRTSACMDTSQGVRSTETLDMRMRCLDRGLATLAGVLEGLTTEDRATLHAANDAVTQLRPPADCAEAKEEARPRDPVLRAELDTADDLLARATAARSLSQYERALVLADRAISAGERAQAPSLVASALIIRGLCESRLENPTASLASYQKAAKSAARARDLATVAEALVNAFHVEGDGLGRRNNALRARPFIELAIESAGQPDHVRAPWLHALAIMLYQDPDQVEEAVVFEREALAIRKRIHPAGHVFIIDSMETLGNIEAARRNYEEAIRLHQQVLDARLASRGASDHTVGWAYSNLGGDEILRSNLLVALDYLRRAVDNATAAGKPNKNALYNLGIAQLELGRWAACAATFARAVELAKRDAPVSTMVADSSTFQGICLLLAGDVERAGPLLVGGAEMARSEGWAGLSTALVHAALHALRTGDKPRARAMVDESLKIAASNAAWRALVVALVVNAERGCAAARPMMTEVFDGAVKSGDRSAQTVVTAPLAECEITAGDHASARRRIEAELAWQAKMGSDKAAGAPLRAALAKLR